MIKVAGIVIPAFDRLKKKMTTDLCRVSLMQAMKAEEELR